MSTRRRHPRPRGLRALMGAGAGAALGIAGLAPAVAADPASTIVLSGVVTEAGTGTPLPGLCVQPLQGLSAPACTDAELTDSSGRYRRSLSVPTGTGTIQVGVRPPASDPYHLTARAKVVLSEATAYVVDLEVIAVGSLTGRAVDADGAPVAGVCPQLRGLDVADLPSAPVPTCSGKDGVWKLSGAPQGRAAVVLAGTPTLQGSYVPRASRLDLAQKFDVVPGRTVTLPDTTLVPGGTIIVHTSAVGRGRNVITLKPMKRTQDVVPGDRYTTGAEADANEPADPQLTNVQAGDYLVLVENVWDPMDCYEETPLCSSLAPWWAPSGSDPGTARQVHITPGSTVELTATMQPYRSLAVTFRNAPAGSAVAVQAYFPSGKPWSQPVQALVGNDGVGIARFLPPADVRLKFTGENAEGKSVTWWYGGTNLATAKPVKVGTDAVTVSVPAKQGKKRK